MMRWMLASLSLALMLAPPTAMAQDIGADQCPALSAVAVEAPQSRRGRREPTPTELLARANEAARQRPGNDELHAGASDLHLCAWRHL
jgi:hypothetical protein